MGGLISALATFLFNASLLKFLAFKAVAFTVIAVILPIILWNFSLDWMLGILTYALSKISTDMPNAVYQITGVTGWIATRLQLDLAISNIVSALATNLLIRSLLRI